MAYSIRNAIIYPRLSHINYITHIRFENTGYLAGDAKGTSGNSSRFI